MNQKLRFLSTAVIAVTATLLAGHSVQAQTYTWSGSANSQFYNTSNWSSTDGTVVFDNAGFRIVRTNAAGQSPAINQWVDWQPGIFDHLGGNLTINADFQIYFNDWLNGDVVINSGASLICRNIIRVGRETQGVVTINGGTMRCLHDTNWQGIFIGVLQGGNGTVNVNDGGLISGGYQVEVGTRDYYPTGTLNVNSGGTSEAYWTTVIGPNGTINVNGGTVNTGQALLVGDLYLDNAANTGTIGNIVGAMNLNSGTVTVNHLDLASPYLGIHSNGKIVIDNGTFRVRRTGVDFTTTLSDYISSGQISAVSGKQLQVAYDGVEFTTITATTVNKIDEHKLQEIKLTPNPAFNIVTITGLEAASTSFLSVTDLTGKVILEQEMSTGVSNAIDISTFQPGMYIASIRFVNGTKNIKFIKK